MAGGIFMSTNEQVTYRIIEDYRSGKVSRKEAAEILGVAEKTVQRKAKKIRDQGFGGVKHGNLGKVPRNKLDDALKSEVLRLVREVYFDFNLFHAREMVIKEHGHTVSYGTFYSWCVQSGLGKGKKRRRPNRARIHRERMANEGLMLQMDGSHHRWNGRDVWCLVACIDDATSDIPYAEFFKSETTFACMKVLKSIIQIKGIPDIIYTDFAGWSGNGKRQHFSQFQRACDELGIRVISTSSAESKGRIERAWRTIQDRLIPELRLHDITTRKGANQYLQQHFLPTYWQKQNTVEPRGHQTRYRPLPAHMNLENVFCMKYERQVYSDNTITHDGERYRIRDRKYGSLKGKLVAVHRYESGDLKVFYGHIELNIQKILKPTRQWMKSA
jgi:hypothetical protein